MGDLRPLFITKTLASSDHLLSVAAHSSIAQPHGTRSEVVDGMCVRRDGQLRRCQKFWRRRSTRGEILLIEKKRPRTHAEGMRHFTMLALEPRADRQRESRLLAGHDRLRQRHARRTAQ